MERVEDDCVEELASSGANKVKDPFQAKASRTRREDVSYFAKAIILVGILTAIGKNAPSLSVFAVPFAMLVYALPVALGTLYDVVVKRFHNQCRYNKDGKLSHYNRSWNFLLPALFVFSLLSALMFVLEAPAWSESVWVVIWIAIPIYWGLFRYVENVGKKEYAPRFYKVRAIFWNTLFVGLLLCVVYAIIPSSPLQGSQGDLLERLQGLDLKFAASPSALLSEADKINSWMSCLVKYGWDEIARLSFFAVYVAKVVLYAAVFFSFASLLGFCTLDRGELKSEFQWLPAASGEELGDARPMRKRYFITLLGVWLVASIAFVYADGVAADAREGGSSTKVDDILDDATTWVGLLEDHSPSEIATVVVIDDEKRAIVEEYQSGKDNLVAQCEVELEAQIKSYYGNCLDAMDEYIEWRDGFMGKLSSLFKFIGKESAEDAFVAQVVESVDRSVLEKEYEEYVTELQELQSGYIAALQDNDPNDPLVLFAAQRKDSGVYAPLELWPSWESEEGARVVADILLSSDGATLREKVRGFIEERRDMALEALEATKADFV